MTQEEKELLLKDLGARLLYGVKVCIELPNHQKKVFEGHIGELEEVTRYGGCLVNSKGIDYRSFNLDIKPYLRPMSSMTDAEKREYQAFFNYDGVEYPEEYIDWLNAHYFDYRGLIERGLALKAPKGMYNLKKE